MRPASRVLRKHCLYISGEERLVVNTVSIAVYCYNIICTSSIRSYAIAGGEIIKFRRAKVRSNYYHCRISQKRIREFSSIFRKSKFTSFCNATLLHESVSFRLPSAKHY